MPAAVLCHVLPSWPCWSRAFWVSSPSMLSSQPGKSALVAMLGLCGLEPFGLELADLSWAYPRTTDPEGRFTFYVLKASCYENHAFIHGRFLRLAVPSHVCYPASGSGASGDHEASRESLGKGGDNRYTLFHSTEAGFSGGCWRGRDGPWRTSGTRKTWCHFLVFVVRQLVY